MLPTAPVNDRIRDKLIKDAIKDLQRWMFPNVNYQNIFSDLTYSYFFERILINKKGLNTQVDKVIEELLYELKFSIKDL